MRFAIDTGGTFTDLVVEDQGRRRLYKAPTKPEDPVDGMLDVLALAAKAHGISTRSLLGRGEILIHATTHALNAVLTGTTARTALVVTEGHEAVLVVREGGRGDAFDFSYEYPEPYIPQALTFGVPERIGSSGEVVVELTEGAATGVARRVAEADVEAVAVCLLWSIVNPVHERVLGAALRRELPGMPITLSHELNPGIREYRRASSVSIDASLRPMMNRYLTSMETRLREAGYRGRVLVVSSTGALLDVGAVASAPVHTLNSGPAMAPVAGAHELGQVDIDATAIVVDAGGTSFDVSVVRQGRIPRTRETWIGPRFRGVMTGFPSVDVRSIGAGGGSIAYVDAGGLLHVGPESAGSVPGPVAYGRGGTRATVTDAALVLGYLDPERFLDGGIALDVGPARAAIESQVAAPLGLGLYEAASAVLDLTTEVMVAAVEDVTTSQGVDPEDAVLIGGGGAAGLMLAAMAARLRTRRALIPAAAAGLSAAGALASELARDFSAVHFTTTAAFDREGVNTTLDRLRSRCETFISETGDAATATRVELFVEARYPRQVWEIEVPLPVSRFATNEDVAALCSAFHAQHHATFAFSEPGSPVEAIGWRARAVCELPQLARGAPEDGSRHHHAAVGRREAWFAGVGLGEVPVRDLAELPLATLVPGPAIIELGLTTVVAGPSDAVCRLAGGGIELVREAGA